MENKSMLWGSENNAVVALLSINLVVFATLRIILILLNVTPQMNPDTYFGVVENFTLTTSANNFIAKPWTLLTYFISHTSYLMLITNLCWLFLFSYMMQQVHHNAHIIPVYIYGGIIGGIFMIVSATVAHTQIAVEGCTTGILAIAGFLLASNAKHKLLSHLPFGGIPIWVSVLLFVIVTAVTHLSASWVLYMGYLAALLIGYLYAKQLKNGKNLGNWMHQIWDLFLGKNFVVKQNN